MKNITYTLLLILLTKFCFAQAAINLIHEKSLSIRSQQFSADNLGNIYTIQKGIISKYNSNGELLNSFQNKTTNIDFIDASNPLRIVGYSVTFGVIYFFDAQLSLQSSINMLEKLYPVPPEVVCNASTASFWTYDQSSTIITNYNDQMQAVAQSQPLNLTVKNLDMIKIMKENEKWLALYSNNGKILLFDLNGNYFKSIEVGTIRDFSVSGKNIVALGDNSIKFYSLLNDESKEIAFPSTNNYNHIWFLRNQVILSTDETINFFQLQE